MFGVARQFARAARQSARQSIRHKHVGVNNGQGKKNLFEKMEKLAFALETRAEKLWNWTMPWVMDYPAVPLATSALITNTCLTVKYHNMFPAKDWSEYPHMSHILLSTMVGLWSTMSLFLPGPFICCFIGFGGIYCISSGAGWLIVKGVTNLKNGKVE